MASTRITSVHFKRYKAFHSFQISLQDFNVLVGPNNAGKSTIIGVFRILAEGLRRARSRNAEQVHANGIRRWGHRFNIADLPISAENIFHDYDDSEPAEVTFRLSNGNRLILHFPEQGACFLLPDSYGDRANTPTTFKQKFDVSVGFVPILGPVEQNELLYQEEAARRALMTSGASRNFRNIWHHYPDQFDQFRALIQSTWPGMDIEKPEIQPGNTPQSRVLKMFCPEERFPREICWAGYGFQVWCQMLTHIVKSSGAGLLVIDEPDIYLHADLQRQLVALLRDLGPDILIATHSTEIISETDPGSLLTINKKRKSASRVKDASQIKRVFSVLGSNLNPTLTQIAKTRRIIFVEGLDFDVLARFARTMGFDRLANRTDFALVKLDGFNPRRMEDLAKGIELTIGSKMARAVVLDRDYRSKDEVKQVEAELKKHAAFLYVHKCKEIENYLLNVSVLTRAVKSRLAERARRIGTDLLECPDIAGFLDDIASEVKSSVLSQVLARNLDIAKKIQPNLDPATINKKAIEEFEIAWNIPQARLALLPGKEMLARLNTKIQELVQVSVSDVQVASMFGVHEIPTDLRELIEALEQFRSISVDED
ncbi:ATP-dependent nuclease [Polaromonas sp. AET17H-212]|uniref:ATP-dependent nuclease n=1 Tax=Polaromonas sp. AET17H-212 TaxID=1977061 RepID=UPI000BBC9E74|nr:ATP-binding protein [Polaromonas sp. AET17H-212]